MPRKLVRPSRKRYINEIFHYCPLCGVVFCNCNGTVTYEGNCKYDPVKRTFKWTNLIETGHTKHCKICNEDLTQYEILIPENIVKMYWKLLREPLQLRLNTGRLKDYRYIQEQIESYVFDNNI